MEPSLSSPDPHPYARLTPDTVLDALDSVGLRGDGRLLQLNSYENRVFQVWLEDGRVVVAKFYRPQRWSDAQILEEHAFAQELAAAEIPVVAPLVLPLPDGSRGTLAHHADFRFAVSPRQGGRAPELELPLTLEWIGRFLGRIHLVGAHRPFAQRPALTPATLGETARDWLVAHQAVAPDVASAWRAVVDAALDAARRAFDEAAGVATLRLHGDCHPGNVLWTEAGPHFVDLDDARNGPAVQDLWMLLSGDRRERQAQLAELLAGYEDFAEFDRRELRLVEPLRTLRQIHHSAWLAQRWDDPAFPAAFPFFGTSAYWSEQVQQMREQLEAMQEPALVA
ncbi:serine/threonine protein kinase [Caldimonas tepidiphila]|uniref:serine/threonine protein kinase n=1 Tax=Caldimonas tepidiphila TaxID=2315841 RepID=UPI000E5C1262|nr:serine/threonine protein kinase [Caldimonas tepidiphila]